MIFSTFDDVKRFIGADANNELRTVEPYFNDAARDYVHQVLSQEEYDSLEANYPDNLTAAQQRILPLVQNAVANFGYFIFADDGTMSITDSGFLRMEHTDGKSAYQWQVREFKNRRWTNGWRALEKLAKVLYANQSDYPDWAASEDRLTWNSLFAWHTLQMKRFFRVDNWGTMWALQAEAIRVQEDVILPMITKEVYDALVDDVVTDSLSTQNEPLLPLAQAVQIFGMLKDAVMHYGFEFGKDGLSQSGVGNTANNSSIVTNTPMAERERLLKVFEKRFEAAKCDLKQYMDANSTEDVFATYYNRFLNVTVDTTDHNEGKGVFLL